MTPRAGFVRRLLARAAVLAAFLAFAPLVRAETPAYVGSAACAGCHQPETEAWKGSHHALAWTLPTAANVLGDFDNRSFEHGGITARFLRDGDRYMIEIEGPDGVRRPYEVLGVAGIDPLQQYLISPEPGRTQAFDIAWDVSAKRWYPVFPGPPPPPGDGFHWTGPYKSWEGRCAECHATGYSRNYDQTTRTYAPKMAEIGVGCEACHGPGAAHLAWAKAPDAPLPPSLKAYGLTADLGASAEAEVQQCMTCHSLREALADGNALPGTNYHDNYTLSLLREGSYGPDGSILAEVYEGGSFLQSKMHAKGVRCSDCHEPHSAKLIAEGNAVCTTCHSPAGNPRFPSLPLKVFDGPEHTFHPEGSTGAQCVSCHMIQRTYMGVDTRHDHYFRVPRPDLASTGSPDACTECHKDRDAAWAAAQIVAWFPNSTHRGPSYATPISVGRANPGSNVGDLMDLAEWDGAAIVRATALEMLAPLADPGTADRVTALLADPDPIVRAAAAGALRGVAPAERLQRLTPVLSDPLRSVRVAAAKALLDAQPVPGSAEAAALSTAMGEWQSSLAARTDFPETHFQIGGAALTMRNWQAAEQAFAEAVHLDPQLVQGWSMVIRIRAATGDPSGAAAALQNALTANPGNLVLLQLASEMGVQQ